MYALRIAGSAQGYYRLPANADLWASEFLAEALDIRILCQEEDGECKKEE